MFEDNQLAKNKPLKIFLLLHYATCQYIRRTSRCWWSSVRDAIPRTEEQKLHYRSVCTINPLQICECNGHVGYSNLSLFQCHLLTSHHTYINLHIVCLLLLCYILSCMYTCISDCVHVVSFPAPNPRPEKGLETLEWFLGYLQCTGSISVTWPPCYAIHLTLICMLLCNLM